jgi:hypothetical protein
MLQVLQRTASKEVDYEAKSAEVIEQGSREGA